MRYGPPIMRNGCVRSIQPVSPFKTTSKPITQVTTRQYRERAERWRRPVPRLPVREICLERQRPNADHPRRVPCREPGLILGERPRKEKLDIDLVVFDMVGTTIEDSGQVLDAFSAALSGNQIEVPASELQQWRGASKRQVLRFFVERKFGPNDTENSSRTQRTFADFRERLVNNYTKHGARAIAGAETTFKWLGERDVKIVLTTGFDRTVADIILSNVGWHRALVDATVCSDEVPRGRPAPYMIFRAMEATGVTDVRRVAKVGDTAFDLMAGANAGVLGVVGVLSGSQSLEQLGCVQHTHIISSVAELPTLLDAEFRFG